MTDLAVLVRYKELNGDSPEDVTYNIKLVRSIQFMDGDNGDSALYTYRYERPLDVVSFPRSEHK